MLTTILNSNELKMKAKRIFILLLVSAVVIDSCITPFEPKGIGGIGNMVVIEGDIIQNDTTKVVISRSFSIRGKNNAVSYISNARVWVESETGEVYTGEEVTKDGRTTYIVFTKDIRADLKYKLCVILAEGQRYESDFLPVLVSPPIDSIGYTSDYDNKVVKFYVETHDAQNEARYYKWTYHDNWEFHAEYFSLMQYDELSGRIKYLKYDENRYYCWNSSSSSSIIIGSTAGLSQDIVSKKTLAIIASTDIKISSMYSIEATQMVISKESFQYWENIKKNSDDIGGIFSPQPSEIGGNIHCVSDTTERVLGYISAGRVARKRIFASAEDIGIYERPPACETFINRGNAVSFKELYECGYDIIGMSDQDNESYWAMQICIDCRLTGTKFKPAFWPTDHK